MNEREKRLRMALHFFFLLLLLFVGVDTHMQTPSSTYLALVWLSNNHHHILLSRRAGVEGPRKNKVAKLF